MKQTNLKLLAALIGAAFAGSASAAGFQLLEQNASGLGNAYAGSAAVAENASTIFFNPAGMTQLKDREFSVGVNLIKPGFEFKNNGSSGVVGNTNTGGDAGELGIVPNAYLSWRLTKDLTAGVGIGAPFGLMTEYDSPWIGSAQSNKFEIKTYNINPSLAWKVNETVSIGGGVNWQRLTADYQRLASISPVPPGNTPLTLKLDDNAWGWNIGALFNLTPVTKLGVSYRSKIKYSLTGTVSASSPSPLVTAGINGNVKADLELPDTAVISLAHQLNDRWELLGDISWTGWSSIPKLDVYKTSGVGGGSATPLQTLHTEFQDTWRVALGATYKYSDAWKLKMGIAYDQTPVKNAETRLVSLPDNDRIWLSAGAQWKLTQTSALDFGVTYLYLKDADINNNQGTLGTVRGTYEDKGWILGMQYSQSF